MNSIVATLLLGAITLGCYAVALWHIVAIFIPRYRGRWGTLSRTGHVPLGPLSCAAFALAFGGMGIYITTLVVRLMNVWLTAGAMTSFVTGWCWIMFIGSAYDHSKFRRTTIEQGALTRPEPLVETATRQHEDTDGKRAS